MVVTVDILVQPRASRAKIGPMHDGRIKIAVTAPPVDGEANAAVIELVAEALGISRGAIEVIAGMSSRRNAQRLAAQTVMGSAKLLLDTDEHPGKLKDMVTSPGGTAIAGLHTLEQGGLRTTLINAVETATKRARELGRGQK